MAISFEKHTPCSCDACVGYPADRLRQIEPSIRPAVKRSEQLDEEHAREAAYIHRYGAAFRATEQNALHRARVAFMVRLAGIQMPEAR
jgi:hypothetical protein